MFLVALPPNSGSTEAPRVFAHTCSVIRNQVVASGFEIIIMKFHLIRRWERQNRTAKSCGPKSEVDLHSTVANGFLVNHHSLVRRETSTIHIFTQTGVNQVLVDFCET